MKKTLKRTCFFTKNNLTNKIFFYYHQQIHINNFLCRLIPCPTTTSIVLGSLGFVWRDMYIPEAQKRCRCDHELGLCVWVKYITCLFAFVIFLAFVLISTKFLINRS